MAEDKSPEILSMLGVVDGQASNSALHSLVLPMVSGPPTSCVIVRSLVARSGSSSKVRCCTKVFDRPSSRCRTSIRYAFHLPSTSSTAISPSAESVCQNTLWFRGIPGTSRPSSATTKLSTNVSWIRQIACRLPQHATHFIFMESLIPGK